MADHDSVGGRCIFGQRAGAGPGSLNGLASGKRPVGPCRPSGSIANGSVGRQVDRADRDGRLGSVGHSGGEAAFPLRQGRLCDAGGPPLEILPLAGDVVEIGSRVIGRQLVVAVEDLVFVVDDRRHLPGAKRLDLLVGSIILKKVSVPVLDHHIVNVVHPEQYIGIEGFSSGGIRGIEHDGPVDHLLAADVTVFLSDCQRHVLRLLPQCP
jgi:hypothetical protein